MTITIAARSPRSAAPVSAHAPGHGTRGGIPTRTVLMRRSRSQCRPQVRPPVAGEVSEEIEPPACALPRRGGRDAECRFDRVPGPGRKKAECVARPGGVRENQAAGRPTAAGQWRGWQTRGRMSAGRESPPGGRWRRTARTGPSRIAMRAAPRRPARPNSPTTSTGPAPGRGLATRRRLRPGRRNPAGPLRQSADGAQIGHDLYVPARRKGDQFVGAQPPQVALAASRAGGRHVDGEDHFSPEEPPKRTR